MMSFEANTRRAIASSILVCCRHTMHIIVAHNVIYHRASREADMTSASYSKCLHNTEVLAWWHCHRRWQSTVVWCVVCAYVPYALCRGLDICGGISSRTGYAILISS